MAGTGELRVLRDFEIAIGGPGKSRRPTTLAANGEAQLASCREAPRMHGLGSELIDLTGLALFPLTRSHRQAA
jgi:hypothetical protein